MYFSHLQHFVDQSHGCMPVTLDLILQLHYTETRALRVNGTFTNKKLDMIVRFAPTKQIFQVDRATYNNTA